MLGRLLIVIIIVASIAPVATAFDNYLIIVENGNNGNQAVLTGYPGGIWGKTIDKIYLAGDNNDIDWLDNRYIQYKKIPFDGENSNLYLIESDIQAIERNSNILDSGSGYYLSLVKPAGNSEYRVLTQRRLPFGENESQPEMILTYNNAVAGMIDQVNQDTIMNGLSRLSGASPIFFNGRQDTIKTRFSGTDDNSMAAEYISQILTSYGYNVEYNGFFTGNLRNVVTYNNILAWAVAENSTAYRTTNGGNTWNIMSDNSAYSLWGVSNIGPDSVWITGDIGTIRFSSDGGLNFSSQPSNTQEYLFGSSFVNSSEGWIASDNGHVLHTTNSGQSWTQQTTPVGSRFYDIKFFDSQYGWAVGRDGSIVRTTDGGTNWARQTSNTIERLYGVDFTDRNNGWVVGWNGVVLHTTDGGTNWQSVSLGTSIEKYQVNFSDASHGCIVGWNGEIFITSNAGSNWTQIQAGTLKNFYSVDFADNQNGYAVGDRAILKTTDGGSTWICQSGGVEGAWRNVIATKPGTVNPDHQVIICGHFDNTSQQPQITATGADDNGSGTIGVIEAARIFANRHFEKTIKFCLWTGEEQGLLGSAAYAEEAHFRGDSIDGVFNYDMISYDGNADNHGELHCGTQTSSIALGNLTQAVISDYTIDLNTTILTWNATTRSDHASFWDYNYPAMLSIEDFTGDFNPFYHTTNDNMSIIVPSYFTNYVRTLVGGSATLAIPDTINTGIDNNEILPKQVALIQSYPNPFNPSATISFTLRATSDIELSIFDILGRKVATLYSGLADAGTHNITWNAGNNSSGIYLYRLSSKDGLNASGRMTLLK